MLKAEGRTEFGGAWVINPPPEVHRKRAIIITGGARGGTSFAASAVANLGIPFTAGGERTSRELNSRYEHQDLITVFQNRDEAGLAEIRDRFDDLHEVWAWKLPAIRYDLDLAAKIHPNPYFVFIFKEPVSVGFRKNNLRGANVLTAMQDLLNGYKNMVDFSATSKQPVLMIGYDSAMANLDEFVTELAQFTGVTIGDRKKVVEAILEDGQRYYEGRRPYDPSKPRRKVVEKEAGTWVRKPNLTKKMAKAKSRGEAAKAAPENEGDEAPATPSKGLWNL
jgi:hypothetical protein